MIVILTECVGICWSSKQVEEIFAVRPSLKLYNLTSFSAGFSYESEED